jgi:hypothetical protein
MKKFPAWFRYVCAVTISLPLWVPCLSGAGGDASDDVPVVVPATMIPVQSPVPYTAKYSVMTNGATLAEATYTLKRSGQGWEFRAHAKPTKMVSWFINSEIDEYSLLETEGVSVRPLKYRYEQKADKEKDGKILQAQYDWQNNTVTVTDGKKTRQLAIKTGTHDPLSAQLALTQCIKNDCGETHYSVIDELELQQRRFERTGVETVRTMLGDHEAVKVSYRRGTRETIIWLASALNYIPVRIQQFKNSELKSEMRITAVNFE